MVDVNQGITGAIHGQVDQPGRSLRSQRRCRAFKSRLVHHPYLPDVLGHSLVCRGTLSRPIVAIIVDRFDARVPTLHGTSPCDRVLSDNWIAHLFSILNMPILRSIFFTMFLYVFYPMSGPNMCWNLRTCVRIGPHAIPVPCMILRGQSLRILVTNHPTKPIRSSVFPNSGVI